MNDYALGYPLSEEQSSLREEARKFASQEIRPIAAKLDEDSSFPDQILKKAHSFGFLNLHQDTELGGTGLNLFDTCLIVEELAAGPKHSRRK